MPRITETRISKLSGGLSDVRLCEAVLKAFYAQDLPELQRLLQLVKGRSYDYKFHKLTQRGQGSRISESGLWDISFAFLLFSQLQTPCAETCFSGDLNSQYL